MNYKKLYLAGLTREQLMLIAGHFALSNIGVTKDGPLHVIISAQYMDNLATVVELCQDVVGKPLEVGMNHNVRATA